jgi:3-oxoadipate enol-lactonase/4-carboxymuconolactone decarboxylase
MPTAKVNGIDLHYDLSGPNGAPVVAFSNSLGSTLEMWDQVVPALASRFQCLRYDTMGHGRSGSRDVATGIDDLAGDLAGLLDALSIQRAHVVGLSLGGMTAQAFAAAYPQRTDSLVLMATSAQLPPPEFWQKRAETVRAGGPEAVVDTIVPRWFTPGFQKREPGAVAQTRNLFLKSDSKGYARCAEAIGAMDLRERIKTIIAPTLVVVGADDPVTRPAMAEDLRARIPGAEMVVLGDCAHLIAVEKPEEAALYLSAFLDRHAPDAPGKDFADGLAIRRQVLGAAHVDRSIDNAGSFDMPWQDFITRTAWHEIWGDPTLPRKTRSLLVLSMMLALHREEEFKLHVRPAVGNGVTVEELRALVLQGAVYAGIPAGNAAMRWLREVLGDELK